MLHRQAISASRIQDLGKAPTRNTILPLPEEEGRGEGEGSVASPNLGFSLSLQTTHLFPITISAEKPESHRDPIRLPNGGGQVTNSSMTTADAFLPTGSINYQNGADLRDLNFGGAGTLAIAPAFSIKGEFQSVIKFNLSGVVDAFNSTYGSNHWVVSSVMLDLKSNYSIPGAQPNNPIFNLISGGRFVIEWIADDDWAEGTGNPSMPMTDGVTYGSLGELLSQPHVPLCTNTYVPSGTNNFSVMWPLPLEPNLLVDICGGGNVSFHFYAADEQVGYLFNSHNYGRGNEPIIHVAAVPLLKIVSGSFTNGVFHLTGLCGDNGTYQIQTTTNLAAASWVTVGTVTADSEGGIQFDDSGASSSPQRFYRLCQ